MTRCQLSPRPFHQGRRGAVLLLALALACLPPLASADNDWHDLHGRVSRGELVPMVSVLDWLEAHYAGQVLEVELEREDGRLVYEVEMLGPRGQRVESEFDAASGELIGIEGVGIDDMRRRP
ncbi:PepSY domain-containing protein [Halomonas sp. A11-A]|uniref:PepSY domain-containing protein n=1 Tax=Halomonas sp. A11-A TaxID=2183985 RepID=UPI000D70E86A|nr:PepSY domain-containing protein [Halomonas sp. A11-A]PWV75351.1 peptidase YpeB-like protein [Halomonas sp. A11-A]